MSPGTGTLTQSLHEASRGDRQALDRVFEALYPDLKRVAHARLYRQGGPAGMHTTALVHESFMRMVDAARLPWQNRAHFLAYAAKTMRHIIVDGARTHLAQRRGGTLDHVTLDANLHDGPADGGDDLIVQVHEALRSLEQIDPALAELVEMRYFAGYTEVQIAEIQGSSERTVRRQWDKARAWLAMALRAA